MGTDRRHTVYVRPWRVDIVRREGIAMPLTVAGVARAVAAALAVAGTPAPASVTVVLTDDDELEALNVAHMGHEGPTDVLSFPMLEAESFDHAHRADSGRRRPREAALGRSRTHIGDIAISVERAIEQAVEGRGGHTGDVRWSPADELRLLVTHGTLHLCGWDHAEPEEEAAMRALENALLDRD
jgi:probable rRNA maturation factor